MKLIISASIIFLLFLNQLLANNFDLYTFKADFVQKIFKDKSKITYKGKLLAKKPYYLLWHYTQPVEKKIYMIDREVVIEEPELEQAILTTMQSEMDFFTLLDS